jgi:Mg2+ and Co2+ transporter CorA
MSNPLLTRPTFSKIYCKTVLGLASPINWPKPLSANASHLAWIQSSTLTLTFNSWSFTRTQLVKWQEHPANLRDGTFSTLTSTQTDDEAKRFEEFRRDVANAERNINGERTYELDVHKDVQLLEKIKDIRDELHTLSVIFLDQRKVIDDFERLFPAGERPERPRLILEKYIADIERMDKHAKETYQAVRPQPCTGSSR